MGADLVLQVAPFVPFAVIVLISALVTSSFMTARLLRDCLTSECIESRLASRPWFVSRFSLLCWEYLMLEADAAGIDETARRAAFTADALRLGGPWHWRMRQMSSASPLAAPLGVPVFVGLAGLGFLAAASQWRSGPALAIGAAVVGVMCVAGAVRLIRRRTADLDLARRLWSLRGASASERVSTLSRWANERLASDPGLYSAMAPATR